MIVVGIAGGSGSGKTTFADALKKQLTRDCVIISQDSYYFDRPDLNFAERKLINYDHPSAFENQLLVQHLQQLHQGQTVNVPTYDFERYERAAAVKVVQPTPVVLVEGILILADAKLRKQFDIKVYVDTDADVRVLRRVRRDIEERGRTVQSVYDQYLATVKPMHEGFVEPSKKYADIIVPEGGHNQVALSIMVSRLKRHIAELAQPAEEQMG